MKNIKEAVDALLAKNEITQEEYDMVKEASFDLEKTAIKINNFSRLLVKGRQAKRITGKFINNIGQSLPTARQAVLTGAGIFGTRELIVDPITNKIKTDNAFEQMQEKVPQLAGKDPEQLRDYFNVIKTFSPKSASNALVAGHLVNKMIGFGGVDHKLVQDLSSIESGLMKPSLIQAATESGAKSMSGFPQG